MNFRWRVLASRGETWRLFFSFRVKYLTIYLVALWSLLLSLRPADYSWIVLLPVRPKIVISTVFKSSTKTWFFPLPFFDWQFFHTGESILNLLFASSNNSQISLIAFYSAIWFWLPALNAVYLSIRPSLTVWLLFCASGLIIPHNSRTIYS